MKPWPELRAELGAKHKSLSVSKLNRLLRRLTLESRLDPRQQDQNNRARLLTDKDVATLSAAALDIELHPRQIPPQFQILKKPDTDDGDDVDDELSVVELARREGPPNTRRSLATKRPKKVGKDDGEDGDDGAPRRSWGKWALIGLGGLALLGALFVMAKRRRDAGGGGSNMAAQPATPPTPTPSGQETGPDGLTAEERAAYGRLAR